MNAIAADSQSPVPVPPAFVVQYDRGALISVKRRDDVYDTEYLSPGQRLGDVAVEWRTGTGAWKFLDTEASGVQADLASKQSCRTGAVEAEVSFTSVRDAIRWSIRVANVSKQQVEIGDLALPLPMHHQWVWDSVETSTKRVVRHSLVAGHGSFVFWSRCNGVGPYLVMTPVGGTPLEYFDECQEERKVRDHRVHIHAKAQEPVIAAHKGSWRQPLTSFMLEPGASRSYAFEFRWANDLADVRTLLYKHGLFDVQVIPGMTVPVDDAALVAIRTMNKICALVAEHPEQTTIERLADRQKDTQIYRIAFRRLGENKVTITCADGKAMPLEFFVTEPVETLIRKRAAFLVEKQQHRDTNTWYCGLISEWNMETHTLLDPEHLDRIKGWREYAVSCDDPGLCKPAYVAAKVAEMPDAGEIAALDLYIEKFVWGGLQRTSNETCPYGIYGIPNWKRNRDSDDPGPKGRMHLWRIYDYPHIALVYFKMYQAATRYPEIKTKLDRIEYLDRAARTAIAMFTIPMEVEKWSAYSTGLYNELVIEEIIDALRKEGKADIAAELERHWRKKVHTFIAEKPNLFGSEYPYDTTGFESTHAFAVYALKHAGEPGCDYTPRDVMRLMEQQTQCNINTRGWLEAAYYLLGSDYRGGGNAHYTLSYMAQMGGWSLLDYALHDSKTPFDHLRLAYASMLSSWALMNSGTPESNYGYWFPGKENDGGAGGGFEPLAYGVTWLEQPHGRGSWYYGCEIDLGFCGALRGAATILADDPLFGLVCYGGSFEDTSGVFRIVPRDGVRRRVFVRTAELSLDLELDRDAFATTLPVACAHDGSRIAFTLESRSSQRHSTVLTVRGFDRGNWIVLLDGMRVEVVKSTKRQRLQFTLAVPDANQHAVDIAWE